MKKYASAQSLSNSRRQSLSKIYQQPQQVEAKLKAFKKSSVSRPIIKCVNFPMSGNDEISFSKEQNKQSDIQQIYQYKIKQHSKKIKQIQNFKKNYKDNHKKGLSTEVFDFNRQEYVIEKNESRFLQNFKSIKAQNEVMTRQLVQINKENKRLRELILGLGKANKKQQKITLTNNEKNYKKEMINKLNQRHMNNSNKLKVEAVQCSRNNERGNNSSKIKQKTSSSKNIKKSSSKSSITMNVNMSFLKIKSPSSRKDASESNQNSKLASILIKSKSRKSLQKISPLFKSFNNEDYENLKEIFQQFIQKKSIDSNDLQKFLRLNRKKTNQFNDFIVYSKRVYTQIVNKLNIEECYNSKNIGISSQYTSQQKKTSKILKSIQQLYKVNSPQTIQFESEFNEQLYSSKLNYPSKDPDQGKNSQSSVGKSNEQYNNPEYQKSYQKYRLKKLNQNLDLLANYENKKTKTQISECHHQNQNNLISEGKIYFSKPISTHVSRKISFNNSLNNSLKNSKIQ